MSEFIADNQPVNDVNIQPQTEGVTAIEQTTAPAPSEAPSGSLLDFLNSRMAGNQTQPTPETIDPAQANPDKQEPPITEPTAAETKTPELNVPDKFKNADGSLNADALLKSYTNMESMYGKQQADLRQMNDLQQIVIALQQQMASANQTKPELGNQLTPEQLQEQQEAEIESFWEKWNQNPMKSLQEMIEQAIQPVLAPIQQEREFQQQVNAWNTQLEKVAGEHEDFYELLPRIQQLSQTYGDMLSAREDAVEILYNLAKGQSASAPASAPKAPTIDELLGNQDFIAKIAQNPAVKNMIINQHMQEIKNNPAPPVLGIKPGGQPPSSTPVDLTDKKTAKEALKAKYAGMFLT